MKPMISLATMTILALAIATAAAGGICSTGQTNLTTNGTHQFGQNGDGATVGKGQLITLDCAAQITEVQFRMIITDEPYDGVAPLQNGDVLKVTIMKSDMSPIAVATTVVDGAPGEIWFSFDFSSAEFRIVPGDYIIGCTTNAPRTAFFRKSPDAVPGMLYTSLNAVWEAVPDQDAMFSMSWDPDSKAVATDRASWSLLKSQFE